MGRLIKDRMASFSFPRKLPDSAGGLHPWQRPIFPVLSTHPLVEARSWIYECGVSWLRLAHATGNSVFGPQFNLQTFFSLTPSQPRLPLVSLCFFVLPIRSRPQSTNAEFACARRRPSANVTRSELRLSRTFQRRATRKISDHRSHQPPRPQPCAAVYATHWVFADRFKPCPSYPA